MSTHTEIEPLLKFAETCGIVRRPQVLPVCYGRMARARYWTFRVYDEEEGTRTLRVKAGMDYALNDVVLELLDFSTVDDVLAVRNSNSRVWHTINTK